MSSESAVILIGVIVTVVILLAFVAVMVVIILRRRAERARVDGLSPAERASHDAAVAQAARLKEMQRELTVARKDYEAGVKTAEKALLRGQKEYQLAITSAQRAVSTALGIGSQSIGSVAGREGRISATETSVTVPQGTFPIDGVTATVDTAGNFATSSRTTVTRVAAGAVLFGPIGALVGASAKKTKAHDLRELYLMVQGPGFATVVTCDPDHGARVRQFAAAINTAAPNKDAVLARRAQAAAAAEANLRAVVANTSTPDRLNLELQAARERTGRIHSAEQRLALESAAPLQEG